jgi:hypothetical protein
VSSGGFVRLLVSPHLFVARLEVFNFGQFLGAQFQHITRNPTRPFFLVSVHLRRFRFLARRGCFFRARSFFHFVRRQSARQPLRNDLAARLRLHQTQTKRLCGQLARLRT